MGKVETRIPLVKEEVLEKTSEILRNIEEVNLAVLFGAIVEEGSSAHDVDLAIGVKQGADRPRTLSSVIVSISRALEVFEDRIDVIDLDRAEIDLKREIIKSGRVLLDREDQWEKLVQEVTAKSPAYSELRDLSVREWLSSNDPSSIDAEVIKRRMEFVKREVDFLRSRVISENFEDVKESPELKRLLERGFHLTVEAMLDTCRHIVSAKGWGPAYTYADHVEKMKEEGGLPEEVGSKLIAFISIRNIIVHRYLDVDYEELYIKSKELAELSEKFETCVTDLLKK